MFDIVTFLEGAAGERAEGGGGNWGCFASELQYITDPTNLSTQIRDV